MTDTGFANLSFEFTNTDSTSRSVRRSDARELIRSGNEHVRRSASTVWGAPDVRYDYKFFGSLGLNLGVNHHLYAFGNWMEREVDDSWYWRSPIGRPGVFTDPRSPAGGWRPAASLLIAGLSPEGQSGDCPKDITGREHHQDAKAVLSRLGPDCY